MKLITRWNSLFLAAGCGLLIAACTGVAGEDLFTQGNEAFLGGRYEEAIDCYSRLSDHAGLSAGLLQNLAHAYRESEQPGPAMLNYQRALWIAPRNPDARAGMARLCGADGVGEVPGPAWSRLPQRLSLSEWTWSASIAWGGLGILSLATGLGVIGPRLRRLAYPLALILVTSGLGMAHHMLRMDRAVILTGDAPLRVSPFAAATPSASLPAGGIVRVRDAHGSFLKVRTASGETGWMAAEHLEQIVPGGAVGSQSDSAPRPPVEPDRTPSTN